MKEAGFEYRKYHILISPCGTYSLRCSEGVHIGHPSLILLIYKLGLLCGLNEINGIKAWNSPEITVAGTQQIIIIVIIIMKCLKITFYSWFFSTCGRGNSYFHLTVSTVENFTTWHFYLFMMILKLLQAETTTVTKIIRWNIYENVFILCLTWSQYFWKIHLVSNRLALQRKIKI